MTTFADLGLSEKTIATLTVKGFEEPTEIQALTIPLLLKNETDIIAQAQTGTGKTAAFGLPLIETLDPKAKHVQAIILAPTRELVIQVCEEINSLKGASGLKIAPIYGGQSMELQLGRLHHGLSIVVGTPGRIIDHIDRKTLKLDKITHFILDEADEMLNMGFIDDIERIIQSTPKEKRVLLFSATMPQRIRILAEKYLDNPTVIRTKTTLTTALTDQIYFEVAYRDKFEALSRIIDIEPDFYGIVFCRTIVEVDELTTRLLERGYSVDALHGDISQAQREKIIGKFRKQQISVMVATDVAARGIDVSNLTHVINFSLPQNPESYIHRIGRTGRAGMKGTAITFITPDEFGKLGFIRQIAKVDIRREEVPRVGQIIDVKKRKISDDILAQISIGGMDDYEEWARELISEQAPETVLAAVLKSSYGKALSKGNYRELTPIRSSRPALPRGRTMVEEEGKTRLFIAKGIKDGLNRKNLIDLIKKTGTMEHLIGNIEIRDTFAFITVPFAEAERILAAFKAAHGKRSFVTQAKPKGSAPAAFTRPGVGYKTGNQGNAGFGKYMGKHRS